MRYVNELSRPGIRFGARQSVLRFAQLANMRLVVEYQATLYGVCLIALACVPLYLMDYHKGSLPVTGLFVSVFLGALIVCVLIRSQVSERPEGSVSRSDVSTLVVPPLITGFVMAPLIYFGMNYLGARVTDLVPAIQGILANDQAYFWKPVWHVALGSVMVFAVSHEKLLVLPLQMRNGLPYVEATQFVLSRVDDKAYSRVALVFFLISVAFLSFFPVISLIIPAMMAHLSVTMYSRLLSS